MTRIRFFENVVLTTLQKNVNEFFESLEKDSEQKDEYLQIHSAQFDEGEEKYYCMITYTFFPRVKMPEPVQLQRPFVDSNFPLTFQQAEMLEAMMTGEIQTLEQIMKKPKGDRDVYFEWIGIKNAESLTDKNVEIVMHDLKTFLNEINSFFGIGQQWELK